MAVLGGGAVHERGTTAQPASAFEVSGDTIFVFDSRHRSLKVLELLIE